MASKSVLKRIASGIAKDAATIAANIRYRGLSRIQCQMVADDPSLPLMERLAYLVLSNAMSEPADVL